MARILFICSRTPFPITGGLKVRLYNTASILSKKHTVDLLILDEAPLANSRVEPLRTEFNTVKLFSYPTHRFYLGTLPGILSRRPLQTHYFEFDDIHQWVEQHSAQYDLLYCNHVRTTEYARGYNLPKVVDLVDAISKNYAKASREATGLWRLIYPLEKRRLRRYERAIVETFEQSFITTANDKRYIERDWRTFESFSVIPNGVKSEVLSRSSSEGEEATLVFLGKMDYFPNVDAVTHFAEDVFPKIRSSIPDAKFVIVGIDPTQRVKQLSDQEGIEVTGFVEDPVEYLQRATLVVAPIRFGAGLQNKVLEAMALGKPVVTTPLGQQGINCEDKTHLFVAEGDAAFAETVITLLDAPAERSRVGTNARELIAEHYTWEAVAPKLLKGIDIALRGNPDQVQRKQVNRERS